MNREEVILQVVQKIEKNAEYQRDILQQLKYLNENLNNIAVSLEKLADAAAPWFNG